MLTHIPLPHPLKNLAPTGTKLGDSKMNSEGGGPVAVGSKLANFLVAVCGILYLYSLIIFKFFYVLVSSQSV